MKRILSIVLVLLATMVASAQNGTLDPTNPPEPQQKFKLTVKAQPAEAATTSGGGEYAEGTKVTVRATAKTNYVFKYWAKNGVQESQTATSFTVTMPAEDVEYVAVFEYQEPEYNPTNPAEPQVIEMTYPLYLVADPVGAGTFNYTNGTKIKEGQTLSLRATPTTGYQFVGWYDADGITLSTTAQFSYTMPSQATTLTARFTYNPNNPNEPSGNQDGVDNAADAVTLVARSYTRMYGEANPTFEYDVTSGTITSGTPVITCPATKTSPVGTYPIVIVQGSVSNSSVNLVNGTLIITKAPLTISAGDYTKVEGEANPTFTPTFSGFKNGETKNVLTKQPVVTTTATTSSPAGTYTVTVSGAEAQNYAISYVNGTLTVTKKEEPTEELVTPPDSLKTETYYVTGKYEYWDGDEKAWVPTDIFGDVQIGFDDNDVYIQGMCEYLGDAWVKGTISGNKVVFPTGQYMGSEEGLDFYFVGVNNTTNTIVDVVLNYNAQTGEYTLPNNLWILNSADKTSVCYGYFYELLLSKTFMTAYVEEAGTLSSSINDDVKYKLEGLKVYGQLNSTDFRLLRDMAGSDYMNNATRGKLKKLDMENTEIVTGGKDYLEWGYAGTWHIENNNELGNSVFYGCKKLEEVVLPEGLTSIKSDAFKYCDNLRNVVFNDNLTSLGDGVFTNTKLVNAELPDNVTTMGAAVFYGCKSLVSATIPKNLKTPLSQTFFDCKNLKSVYSHLLNPAGLFGSTDYTAFDYYDANYNLLFTNATLYVPAGTKTKYKNDSGWKKFNNIVEVEENLPGDVNGDGVVNVADIGCVIDCMSGVGTVDRIAADVNGDGKVDVADIATIIDIMAGK